MNQGELSFDVKPPNAGTQCERLLEHLQNTGALNPLSSWQTLGIYRLSARIEDLRKAGYNIKTTRIEVLNRFKERCKVAQYSMDGE